MASLRRWTLLAIVVEHVGCGIWARALLLSLSSDAIQVAWRFLNQRSLLSLLSLSLCVSLGSESLREHLRSPCRLRRSIR